jgi:hypothetical protein
MPGAAIAAPGSCWREQAGAREGARGAPSATSGPQATGDPNLSIALRMP